MNNKNIFLTATLILILLSGCNTTVEVQPQDKQSAEINYNFSRDEYAKPAKDSSTNAPISAPNTQ